MTADPLSVGNPCRLLGAVIELAHAAGLSIMDIYTRGFDVRHKDDRTPVTTADLAAHETITAGLRALTPDVPVLSEESADVPYAQRAAWRCYWLIDPLDGTREFIKRNGEFTVNIALVCDHRPVLGVVYVPVTKVSYHACAGQGAYKQAPGEPPVRLQVQPLGTGPVRVAGSRSHRGASLDAFLTRLGAHEIVSMGSALKSCLVAEGAVDVYPRLGPTSEWDTAAAQCVVEEAGGHVTDTAMRPLRYNTKPSLLNPSFFVFGDARRDWSQYLPPASDQAEEHRG
ncbi:MAG: 3'(2'),5'-bisphosphate nucleotidase CysQ [Gammaproteobacteria bacterium]|nr:3'(2'),5'-bisphosphate nucleotidase CysQ [Gammaproteobacteria bacterium]